MADFDSYNREVVDKFLTAHGSVAGTETKEGL